MTTSSRRKRLAALQDDQIATLVSGATELRDRGFVEGPADLYPDYVPATKPGYTRHAVNVPLMTLLYEQVVVYVSPSPEERLQEKFSIPLASLVDLAEVGIVLPLVGHLEDYTDPAFDALLALDPPSIWARGLGVLEVLDMWDTLDEAQCPLPVTELARTNVIRRWFGAQFPTLDAEALTGRIKQELLTNYADLCIFDEAEVASSLAAHRDPARLVGSLFALNEVRTYPTLFGLGGTANYDLASVKADARLTTSLARNLDRGSDVRAVPRSLSLLLRGLELDVPTMSTDDIIQFHSSGDATRLRSAVSRFESLATRRTGVAEEDNLELFLGRAEEFQTLLREAVAELHDPRRLDDATAIRENAVIALQAGGLAAGGWLGGWVGALGALGGAKLLERFVPAGVKERLIAAGMLARFGLGTAQLWGIRTRRHKS